jgi:protein O-GlcNAc transferase
MNRNKRVRVHGTSPRSRPIVAPLLHQAAAAHAQGLTEQAEQLYRSVLRVQPVNLDATQFLGLIALQTGRASEAIALLRRATELHPNHAQTHANLATALLHVRSPEEALRHYERALDLDPGFVGVLNNQGNALQALNRHAEAAESFGRLLEIAPHFDFAFGNRFRSLRHCCDWREYAAQLDQTLTALQSAARVDRPFSFLSVCDSIAQQRECGRLYAAHLCPAAGTPLWQGQRYEHERIRIAYVSADFRDHVMSYMMAPIYERQDARRFDTIGVSLGGGDDSDIARRSQRALGEFINGAALSDQQIADRLRKLEVDIAVDLMGFTLGCRPGIFARRPAPLQVSFLGFPASMGVPYIDYIVADEFVIPETAETGYSEKVVRLPDCFQPNDERRAASQDAQPLSRSAAGLSESALVLCSFNNSYKLNPRFFDIWTRVMKHAPGSVLWLLGEDAVVRKNLLAEAAARGIGAERIVFAPRVTYAQHLSRLKLADLCLDTLPFNAGATASDALWAGVPLLTCAGEAFAARMAGSLLHALQLPELVTSSAAEYEERAIELVCQPARLAELKARLAANLRTQPLYDSARYCRHLEAAYEQMRARLAGGEPPASFSVAALD